MMKHIQKTGADEMIQFGMPTLIENRTLEENAALCGELGLRFIELNMNFPEYQIDQLEETDRFCIWQKRPGSIIPSIWMRI